MSRNIKHPIVSYDSSIIPGEIFWYRTRTLWFTVATIYGSVPEEALKNETVTRIGAHSDFGSITLLVQDEVGGLEIEDPNNAGSFIVCRPVCIFHRSNLANEEKQPTPYVQGSLIVNAGDFLARCTIYNIEAFTLLTYYWSAMSGSNDAIRSTVHRVRAPTSKVANGLVPERYSIPFVSLFLLKILSLWITLIIS